MSTSLPGTGLINLTVPTPGGDTDVWDTILNDNSLTEAARVMYAAREDRNISVRGGGKIAWNSGTGQVSFTEDIVLHDHITDKTVTITTAASPVTLSSSNQIGYIVKNREPASNQSITSVTVVAAGALPDAVGDNGNIVLFHRTSDATLLIPWLRREIISGDYFVPRTGFSFYEWKASNGRPNYKSVDADTSRVTVPASSSKPAVVMINGKIYANTADAIIDLDTAGRNGLDTGTKAADTVYYLYAIPPTSGFTFDLVCSITGPATGPTGFSLWTYLGAFATTTSSAVLNFISTLGMLEMGVSSTGMQVTVTNASPATAKTLLIPVTATHVLLRSVWGAVNAVADQLTIGPNATDVTARHRATTTTAGNNAFAIFWCPVTEAQKVYANVTTVTTDSTTLRVLGWIDAITDWQ